MPGGNAVEVDARWQCLVGPESVVPSAALQPFSFRRLPRRSVNAIEHFVERVCTEKVHVQLHLATFAEVCVGIIEAGHGECSVEIDDARLRAAQSNNGCIGAGL